MRCRFFDAVPGGDIAAARASLDPDIEWIEPEVRGLWFGGTHHGADAALKEVVEPTFDNVDDFNIRINQYLDAGEEIIALGGFQGKGKATGRQFEIQACFVCTVRGGKIVRFRAYHNTAQWLEALGQPVA
ncbi:MAG: nuclear transport factor 2 family protein [Nitrospiraceae bacterium]|nr:nuclear transport factor 2 family protein [Nitrospiraceae bacterium]